MEMYKNLSRVIKLKKEEKEESVSFKKRKQSHKSLNH